MNLKYNVNIKNYKAIGGDFFFELRVSKYSVNLGFPLKMPSRPFSFFGRKEHRGKKKKVNLGEAGR